jgi:hypothetical protein
VIREDPPCKGGNIKKNIILESKNFRSSAKTKFEIAVTAASILDLNYFDWFKLATKKLEEINLFQSEELQRNQQLDQAIQIIR